MSKGQTVAAIILFFELLCIMGELHNIVEAIKAHP